LSIEDFNNIKNIFVNKYSNKILLLRKKYIEQCADISISEFKKLNALYRIYIKKLIYEVVLELKKYYNINICVALNGSLARHSNNLFSDIDINYLTNENIYYRVIEFEDKVNYILQETLCFRGKDKIHSMVVYLPLISDRKIENIHTNKYPLNFNNGTIYTYCRNNAEKLMYETYNSTRNIYDVVEYLNNNDTIEVINEWTYCFDFVYDGNLSDIYFDNRIVCRTFNNIKKLIIKVIEELKGDNIYLNASSKKVANLKLKKIYKTIVLSNFYKVLAIFYRIDKNITEFNLDEFYKNSRLLKKEIFNYFNKYLMVLQNLQFILDVDNIDLSSHSDEIIEMERVNYLYKKTMGRNNILEYLNKYKNKIYELCLINLEEVLYEY